MPRIPEQDFKYPAKLYAGLNACLLHGDILVYVGCG